MELELTWIFFQFGKFSNTQNFHKTQKERLGYFSQRENLGNFSSLEKYPKTELT
jgi:hypothetical protein